MRRIITGECIGDRMIAALVIYLSSVSIHEDSGRTQFRIFQMRLQKSVVDDAILGGKRVLKCVFLQLYP